MTSKRTFIPQTIAIIFLLLAFNPPFHHYYDYLRWVICGMCGLLAVKAIQIERIRWAVIFGIIAILYNPIIIVRLKRETWSVADAALIVAMSVSIFCLNSQHKIQIGKEG